MRNVGLLKDCAFIDGAWLDGDRRLDVYNPADGSVVGSVPDLGAMEAAVAVSAAHRAFDTWRTTPAKERATTLRRWSSLMLDNKEDLARLMTAEQGKPLAEAAGEVAYAAAFLEWFSEEVRRVTGDILTPHQPGGGEGIRRWPRGK